MKYIIVTNRRTANPMPFMASQSVWAYFLLEACRNGQLQHHNGVVELDDGATVKEMATWYTENVGNGSLWRVTITTEMPNGGKIVNIWEGNANCFYTVS